MSRDVGFDALRKGEAAANVKMPGKDCIRAFPNSASEVMDSTATSATSLDADGTTVQIPTTGFNAARYRAATVVSYTTIP